MLRPPPAFWGAVVPNRIAAYEQKLSRHRHASAALVKRQHSRKLALLFAHYRIADKKDMATLAWALALEHVPGFKIQFPEAMTKRGRKRKWHHERLQELYRTTQSIKQQHRYNDRQALTFMVNNEQQAATWGVPMGHKGSKQQWIETLEARLQGAKHFHKLCEEAERSLQAAATMKFRK